MNTELRLPEHEEAELTARTKALHQRAAALAAQMRAAYDHLTDEHLRRAFRKCCPYVVEPPFAALKQD